MTDDAQVRTTVIIPVWDDYIGADLFDALASVRAQQTRAHIIIIDNASEPPVPDTRDAEVIRSAQRLTLGGARNLGLERVQTPYVVVWDADDVMLPGTLSLLEREMESAPELAAFAMGIVEDSGERHRWPRRWVRPLARIRPAFLLLHCMWSLLPTTGATIMRTDLLHAGGGYSETDSGDDWVAGVSLAFRGWVRWSEQPGRVYRRGHRSVWADHSTAGHLLTHARMARARVRTDPGIPRWAKRALPLIQFGQYSAIGAHVLLAAIRQLPFRR